MCQLFPALLALVIGRAGAQAVVRGCFLHDYAFADLLDAFPILMDSATACQAACYNRSGCVNFGYFGQNRKCYFGKNSGSLQPNPGAISGPPQCSTPATSCVATPDGVAFKAATNYKQSMAAWPTLSFQPQNLQCWPRDIKTLTPLPCQDLTVLEDLATGWPGFCKGLVQVKLGPKETCRSRCRQDMTCSVWQAAGGSCWQGIGYNCFERPRWNIQVAGSQRVLRGQWRVLVSLVGIRVKGLLRVFDKYNAALSNDAVTACRNACLSLVACQFWQLSNTSGCYIEGYGAVRDKAWNQREYYNNKPVDYPVVTALQTGGKKASNIVAGEFLQRSCNVAASPGVPTTPAASPSPAAPSAVAGSTSSSGATASAAQAPQTVGVSAGATTTTSPPGTLFGQPWVIWLVAAIGAVFLLGGIIALVLHMMQQRAKRNAKEQPRKRGLEPKHRELPETAGHNTGSGIRSGTDGPFTPEEAAPLLAPSPSPSTGEVTTFATIPAQHMMQADFAVGPHRQPLAPQYDAYGMAGAGAHTPASPFSQPPQPFYSPPPPQAGPPADFSQQGAYGVAGPPADFSQPGAYGMAGPSAQPPADFSQPGAYGLAGPSAQTPADLSQPFAQPQAWGPAFAPPASSFPPYPPPSGGGGYVMPTHM